MRTLSHFRTLIYYDGAQLFVAKDQLGTSYVCLLAQQSDESDTFLCVPVSLERLHDFTSGAVDLLSLIRASETEEAFVVVAEQGDTRTMSATSVSPREIPVEWMPEPGLLLPNEALSSDLVVEQARDRQRAIIHCSLNPPEAKQEAKIAAERLAQAAKILQRVVKHAYRKSLRDMDPHTREAIGEANNYELEVFAFSPGSFTLHMQTAAPADMWGYSPIEKALRIIDAMTEHVGSAEEAVQIIAGYGGHVATSYKDLLQFIVTNKTPLSYSWSTPQSTRACASSISESQAEPLYQALAAREDIGVESKTLVGVVTKADSDYGHWRMLVDDERRDYSGQSDPHALSLSGVEIGARYEFVCDERLSEERGTGRESTVLHLKSIRRL